MNICIALYKGKGRWRDSIVRYWTKSAYSHAELLMPDNTSITIVPFDFRGVTRLPFSIDDDESWDFICLAVSPAQLRTIEKFYEETQGRQYDWLGMIASQVLPYHIKHRSRWYCSEWIAYALRLIRSIEGLHKVSDMSPGALANLLPGEQKIRLAERPMMNDWNDTPVKTWEVVDEPED